MTKAKAKQSVQQKKEDSSQGFAIQVKRIKEMFFSVNEQLHIPDPSKLLKLELVPMLGFHLESNSVGILTRVFYHYEERPIDEILFDIKVDTRFEVVNLKDYFNETGTLILPPDTIITMVSLSISHARALLAQSLSGTAWQDVIMPLINPVDVSRFYFAYMFGEEKEVLKTDASGKVLGKDIVNKSKKVVRTGKRVPSKNSY